MAWKLGFMWSVKLGKLSWCAGDSDVGGRDRIDSISVDVVTFLAIVVVSHSHFVEAYSQVERAVNNVRKNEFEIIEFGQTIGELDGCPIKDNMSIRNTKSGLIRRETCASKRAGMWILYRATRLRDSFDIDPGRQCQWPSKIFSWSGVDPSITRTRCKFLALPRRRLSSVDRGEIMTSNGYSPPSNTGREYRMHTLIDIFQAVFHEFFYIAVARPIHALNENFGKKFVGEARDWTRISGKVILCLTA
ncbi:hypothetical protein B0J17DRAFT_708569 [Rhizoctonia solani]|nr:hypothetical protein B0J17DRAFT_708569 [Rhizoctonia solani]